MDPLTSSCILVTTDNALLRRSLCEALSKVGYQLIEAPDGAEALRLAGEYDGLIHALITDEQMPGLDGYQLVRQLKPERPDLRILLLSAEPEKDFPAKTQYDAYLQKPVSPRVVVLTVKELLQKQREQGILAACSGRVQAILVARQDHSMTLEELETELQQLSTEELEQISRAVIDHAQ